MASDAGAIWYAALSNAGKSIGDGVGEVVQKQQHLDSLMQFADMLGKAGFDPTTGTIKMLNADGTDASQQPQQGSNGNSSASTKAPKLSPIIDPGFLNAFKQKTYGERMRSQGALEALLGMGTKLAFEGARARLRSQFINPLQLANYNLRLQGEVRREKGLAIRQAQEGRMEQGQRQRELIARQKSVDAMLRPKGLDRNSLFAFDQHRTVDSVGNSTDKTGAGIAPGSTDYVGVPNNDGQLIPIEKDRLQSYQRAAAQATGDPRVVKALDWLSRNPDDPRAPRVKAALQRAIANVTPEPVNEQAYQPEPEDNTPDTTDTTPETSPDEE